MGKVQKGERLLPHSRRATADRRAGCGPGETEGFLRRDSCNVSNDKTALVDCGTTIDEFRRPSVSLLLSFAGLVWVGAALDLLASLGFVCFAGGAANAASAPESRSGVGVAGNAQVIGQSRADGKAG
jgi:hypothetical protein